MCTARIQIASIESQGLHDAGRLRVTLHTTKGDQIPALVQATEFSELSEALPALLYLGRVGGDTYETVLQVEHGLDGASVTPIAKGAEERCRVCGRTPSAGERPKLNPARRASADLAARQLSLTLGSRRGALGAWAERLSIRHQVASRFTLEGGPRVAVGDVFLMEGEDSLRYFETCAALVRGKLEAAGALRRQTVSELVRKLAVDEAQLTIDFDKAIQDGQLSPPELQQLASDLRAVEGRSRKAAEACETQLGKRGAA